MKFVDPKNDVAFKKIFGNEAKKEILVSFLNAVLGLSGDREIADLEILNPYQTPKIEALKETLLNVKARDKRGVTFIVEMQIEYTAGLKKRFLYYTAKEYVTQIERGEEYPHLNQIIFIGILDFNAFQGQSYLTRHLILNTETHEQELQDLEFNFIELPKFTKREEELETVLEKWLYFIKNASGLEMIPVNADFRPLRTAYEVANSFSWKREDLEVYEHRGIKIQDERGAIQHALEEGLQQGWEQDHAAGRQEGEQHGERKATIRTIRQILTIRFGPPPPDLERHLEPHDLPALQQLAETTLTAPALSEWLAQTG
jgi:predicted transposase/invertase (TIGR01784 family)